VDEAMAPVAVAMAAAIPVETQVRELKVDSVAVQTQHLAHPQCVIAMILMMIFRFKSAH
jgi:hypothetical protein